jgi:hypothetical protein
MGMWRTYSNPVPQGENSKEMLATLKAQNFSQVNNIKT